MLTGKKKKCVKKKTEGRDKIEVQPEENIEVDKTAKTYSDFQKQRQSKSTGYTRAIKKPYRVSRTGTMGVRHKKI